MKSESQLQSACFLKAWNDYPQTRKLLCYNLGNSANKIQGVHNKAMGLIAGRSDMVLYWNQTAYHLELKLPGQKQSRSQVEWMELVQSKGYRYDIVTTLEEFEQWLTEILTS